MWTNGKPTREGWYFWKKRETNKYPWLFHTYYIIDGDCWSGGNIVDWPVGGYWKANCTYLGL